MFEIINTFLANIIYGYGILKQDYRHLFINNKFIVVSSILVETNPLIFRVNNNENIL